MKIVDIFFKGMLVIGLILLVGRIITAICRYFDVSFPTFFTDYSVISIIILIVGLIGTEILHSKKRGRN